MSRHAEQLVGALFDVLDDEGHTRARQQLIQTYRSHAASERSELVDRLVDDFAVLLTQYLTAEEELEVLTTTVEYLVRRFVSVVEVAPVAVVVVDGSGTIQLWNDGAERMFGWTEADVLGEPYLQLIVDPPNAELSLSRLQGGHRITGAETRHRHRNGSTVDVRLWAAPLRDHDEEFTGATFVGSDISERKQREQRLSVLNRVLRHNIRNDLTIIRGHLDLLADAVPPENDHAEAIRDRLEGIDELSETARHVERLRGETPQDGLTTFDASAVLEDQLDRLRADWPEATLDIEIPSSASVVAHELLPYALENLLENALEHNDSDDPAVRVDVSRASGCHPDRLLLTIADNGPGLPELERKVLMGNTETALVHSTGTGLWVTRWIVHRSGGQLRVDSDRSEGTRVTVGLRHPAGESERSEDS